MKMVFMLLIYRYDKKIHQNTNALIHSLIGIRPLINFQDHRRNGQLVLNIKLSKKVLTHKKVPCSY